MTRSIADEVNRQRHGRRPKNPAMSLAVRLIERAAELGARPEGALWPSPKWRDDPVGFAHDVLGVKLWAKQVEILEAIRDHKRVAVSGGRKVGKDFVVGVAALWWYASFEDARVIMTATTAKQVDGVLWRDIKKLLTHSGLCYDCKEKDAGMARPCPHSAILDGELGELARTGLKAHDYREINGYTAKEAEGIAGTSGTRLMYLLDEASGIADEIHIAIRGNVASDGCREVMISNPTRNEGKFFDAFHESERFYKTFFIDSETSPNVLAGRAIYPGLASREWIAEQREEWGADSALYKVHVKGQFVLAEDGKILSIHAIAEATARHSIATAEGTLRIGIDPAGEGGNRDESAFASRRGKKVISLHTRLGLSASGHITEALGMIKEHGKEGEHVTVAIDAEGLEGARVAGAFLAFLQNIPDTAPQPFTLIVVRSSQRAQRQPLVFDRIADELWGNLAAWIREGGALPSDAKLERELHAQEWHSQVTGRIKITSKDEIRKQLGRSPDRADAIALAVWEPIDYEAREGASHVTRAPRENDRDEIDDLPVIDPWEGLKAFGG